MRDDDNHSEWRSNKLFAWMAGSVIAALVLTLLILGRTFLIPVVLAFFISSILSAVVDRIRGIRLAGRAPPNWLASILAITLMAVVLVVLYSVIAAQINVVMIEAPAFILRAQHVVLQMVAHLSDDLAGALTAAFQEFTPQLWFMLAAGSAGHLLVTVIMIGLYVGFLLAERPWVKGKVAELFPDAARRQKVQANFEVIRHNVHHYLLLKTLISAFTAGVVYVIALFFDLPFATPIAILSFLLNFIPNLGSIIATALPVLVALVHYDSISVAMAVLATIGVIQFVLGNVIDPMVTGRGLQMSSLAIVISLTFWSAIWGIVGMFLAVPLMVIVMIVCDQIPALRPVAILLSKTGQIAKPAALR